MKHVVIRSADEGAGWGNVERNSRHSWRPGRITTLQGCWLGLRYRDGPGRDFLKEGDLTGDNIGSRKVIMALASIACSFQGLEGILP